MGEQFELNLTNPPDIPPPKIVAEQIDPNADVDAMTLSELAKLKVSLEGQIRDARRTEPGWAADLQTRLSRVEERLAAGAL